MATTDPTAARPQDGAPLSNWRLAAFAAPCIPVAAMLMPVTVYLPNYYARDLGVSLAAVTFAFAAVRLFDLWLDPVLGFLIDKTNTRFGRFKPWLAAGLPIAVLAIWMLFMARPGIDGAYILTWLIMGYLGQSMATMAHVAWAARLAPDYGQRARVFGWWQGFVVLGMLTVLAMPPFTKFALGLDHAAGVRAMGWFVLATLPPTVLLAMLVVGEPAAPANTHHPRLRQYWDLVRRPSVLRVLGTDILVGTGPIIGGTLFFFYFEAMRGYDRSAAGLLLLLYFGGALAGAPLWIRLGRRLGKHRALAVAAVAYATAQASVLITPHGLIWGVITMTLAGVPYAASHILLRAMMADLGDEERLASGVDRSGLLFGLLSGTVKIGASAGVLAAGGLLTAFGFDAGLAARNSPAAQTALSLTFALAPAVLALAGAALIRGHRMTEAAHGQIRRRLEERDAARALAEVQPPAGAVAHR